MKSALKKNNKQLFTDHGTFQSGGVRRKQGSGEGDLEASGSSAGENEGDRAAA